MERLLICVTATIALCFGELPCFGQIGITSISGGSGDFLNGGGGSHRSRFMSVDVEGHLRAKEPPRYNYAIIDTVATSPRCAYICIVHHRVDQNNADSFRWKVKVADNHGSITQSAKVGPLRLRFSYSLSEASKPPNEITEKLSFNDKAVDLNQGRVFEIDMTGDLGAITQLDIALSSTLDGKEAGDYVRSILDEIKRREETLPAIKRHQIGQVTSIVRSEIELEKSPQPNLSSEQTVKDLAKTTRSEFSRMEFVLIPPGTFVMGSPNDEFGLTPLGHMGQHKVSISRPFYLGKYEVTQAEFEKVMGFNPSSFTHSPRQPVEMITWYDAAEFCNRLSELDGLQACYRIGDIQKDGESITSAAVESVIGVRGYRLPTEAEWEYACRAGTTTPFSFGATVSRAEVNYNGDSPPNRAAKEGTIPVEALGSNAWGLHQMHGNVSEWCSDWHEEFDPFDFDDDLPTTDPTGPEIGSRKVMRGGGWSGGFEDSCQSAKRSGMSPGHTGYAEGFRVVLGPAQR